MCFDKNFDKINCAEERTTSDCNSNQPIVYIPKYDYRETKVDDEVGGEEEDVELTAKLREIWEMILSMFKSLMNEKKTDNRDEYQVILV